MLILYVLVGLVALAFLCWLLVQITARQRQLQAELRRLEQLAAEVALNAEAVLDRADERIASLHELLTAVDLRARANANAAPAPAPALKFKPAPAPEPAPEPSAAARPRPQSLHAAVWSLARQGKGLDEIVREVGVPRGEAQLILNLRKKNSA